MCRSLSDNGKLNTVPENSVLPARVPVAAIKATKHSTAPTQADTIPHHQLEEHADTPLLDKRNQDQQKGVAVISRSPKSSVKRQERHETVPVIKKQLCSATQSPHYLKNIRVHRWDIRWYTKDAYQGGLLNEVRCSYVYSTEAPLCFWRNPRANWCIFPILARI